MGRARARSRVRMPVSRASVESPGPALFEVIMNAKDERRMKKWLHENMLTMAKPEEVYRAGHEACQEEVNAATGKKLGDAIDRALELGRKQGYEEVLADMDERYANWQSVRGGCQGLSFEYARKGLKLHSPTEPTEETLDARTRELFDKAKENAFAMGKEEGSADLAEAVQAEHEATRRDGLEACDRWVRNVDYVAQGNSLESYVRSCVDVGRHNRTTPPPAKVLVRITKEAYDESCAAWREQVGLELVEPGDTEGE